MKKFLIIILVFILSGLAIGLYKSLNITDQIHTYMVRSTQEQFGDQPVDAEQEKTIRAIAHEMGITESIIIRKMNIHALQSFGYWNACAIFPLLFNCFPMSNQPFLYISQGFFEDLTPQEQRFLIGHELIHIKERHVCVYNLFLFSTTLLIVLLFIGFRKRILSFIAHNTRFISSHQFATVLGFFILLQLCLSVPNLIGLWYRRHIEWQADMQSIATLQSHEGGIQLIERWVKEYRLPWHNQYALLEDHPSCFERRAYCLTCKDVQGTLT